MRNNFECWQMVKEIDENYSRLSDWEIEFIGDLVDRQRRRGNFDLSLKQMSKIEQIYQERGPGEDW